MKYTIDKFETTAIICILALVHAPESEASQYREAHSWLRAESNTTALDFGKCKLAAYTIDLHRLPDVVHDLERLGFKFSE